MPWWAAGKRQMRAAAHPIPHCSMCPCDDWRRNVLSHRYETCRFAVPHPMLTNARGFWYCPDHDGTQLGEM